MVLRVCRKLGSERQMRAWHSVRSRKLILPGGTSGYRGAINSDKLYYPRYILSRMKSNGPCLPSLSATPVLLPCDRDILPPSLPLPPFQRSTVGTCTPVIASEGDMRLVPLERKCYHFLLAIFLAPSLFFLLPSFSTYPFPLASLLS